jgi:1-acyl-sn-glycerol-3-phosphate acyltransferase
VKLRAVFRLLRVALHLSGGLLTVALVYPFCGEASRLSLKQRWSIRLLCILGISHQTGGEPPQHGLVMSNHISFVDVFAINAWMPSSFVAKDDVRHWPLIGWLASHTDTLFLERGSRSAAQRAREHMVEHLQAGKRVVVFPEGTTSNGDGVLPFHSAMFQAAIDAAVTVTPLAVHYIGTDGTRSYAAAFVGETTLIECFWSIACADGITITTSVLPPLLDALPDHAGDRRHLSAHAHKSISHHLSHLH